MDEEKRPMNVLLPVIPGLGQVYCGEILRGILIFCGTYLLLTVWMFGWLSILDLLDFGYLDTYLILLLLAGLAVWGWGAYDAYRYNRMMVAGEIPWREPRLLHLILFVVMVIVMVLAAFFLMGLILALFGFMGMVNMFSPEYPR